MQTMMAGVADFTPTDGTFMLVCGKNTRAVAARATVDEDDISLSLMDSEGRHIRLSFGSTTWAAIQQAIASAEHLHSVGKMACSES